MHKDTEVAHGELQAKIDGYWLILIDIGWYWLNDIDGNDWLILDFYVRGKDCSLKLFGKKNVNIGKDCRKR